MSIGRLVVFCSPKRASESPATGAEPPVRAGKVWFLAPDGPPSTDPEGRTDDATAPSRLGRPRSRRGHVQLNCLCRPTAPAHKSVRDHNSRPTPRKPCPQNAEGVQGGVVDCKSLTRVGYTKAVERSCVRVRVLRGSATGYHTLRSRWVLLPSGARKAGVACLNPLWTRGVHSSRVSSS